MSKENQTLRVAAQFTIRKNSISLVAEESVAPFTKGDVVRRVSRLTLDRMERPLNVLITRGGVKIRTK